MVRITLMSDTHQTYYLWQYFMCYTPKIKLILTRIFQKRHRCQVGAIIIPSYTLVVSLRANGGERDD